MAYSRSISSKSSITLFLLLSLALHLVVIAAVRDLGTREEVIDLSEPGKVILRLLQPEKASPLPPAEVERSAPIETAVLEEPVERAPIVPAPVTQPEEPIPAAAPVRPEEAPVEVQHEPAAAVPTPVMAETEPIEIPAQDELSSVEQPLETVEIAKIESNPPPPTPILGTFTTFGSGGAGLSTSAGDPPSPQSPSQSTLQSGEVMVPFDSLLDGASVPKPLYPDLARRWGHEGVAVIRIYVNGDGSVEDAVLLSSSGYPELDDAALWTVERRWKFKSTGRVVTTVKEFEFKLER